jgi:uncharacterized HAD superfamily protein
MLLVLIGGCSSVYYGTMAKFGYEKRDILVSKVKDARNDQDAAKEQFKTTLQRFQEVTNFNGGELEAKYKKLSDEYDSCVSRADDVHTRIEKIQSVANDMFSEWKTEIGQYTNQDLKRSSQQKLEQTKQRYEQLITVMKKAEDSMKPVLAAFHDQVLYLKHNLNAQAIASLQTTSGKLTTDVNDLIKQMESSIAEADSFVKQIQQ